MKKKMIEKTLVGVVVFLGIVYLGSTRIINNTLSIDRILQVPQATVLLDKDGNELFRFFEEDRTWLEYEEISSHMINAIIAVEDQNFRNNQGTDKKGLLRAIRNNLLVRRQDQGQIQGGSTITQQLVKNIFLSNERTISRKVREIVLARELTRKRTASYRQHGYNGNKAFIKAKQAIISSYLNYVFFGNHAYGIDAAARHYFQTDAASLTLLHSSILASLPQAPSLYNPTLSPNIVMGSRQTTTETGNAFLSFSDSGATALFESLANNNLVIGNNCLSALTDWATVTSGSTTRLYQHGRKDRVLCRIYELGYATQQDIAEAFIDTKDLTFHKAKFPIRAPHFVYRAQSYLLSLPPFTEQNTDIQQLSQAGLTVTTTLDSSLQEAAENALLNYRSSLNKLGGNNRAIIHVNSTNGDVLSYVGSLDFFDEAIHGQVDVLQAIRQVGSTVKPFLYAYLLKHYPFTTEGTIVDYPLPKDSPGNHDNMFRGKMTIAKALGSSRNLPAVRVFLAMGGHSTFVPYLRSLGFVSLDPKREYSYPLALGADAMTLFQLTQAYIQLSATGDTYTSINPIISITAPDGEILYSKQHEHRPKIIPDTVAQMIRSILSDKNTMPKTRRRLRTLPIANLALKTGTSDIKVGRTTLPRDALSVVYTPTDVIVTRAGNTDGSAMGPKAFGGEMNHYSLREYLDMVVANGSTIDQPRITETHYAPDGSYAGKDHKELTDEQKYLLRRAVR